MINNGLNYDEKTYANNEQKIKCEDLLTEIKPLLDEYFIGNFDMDEQAITYSMLNVQKFKLSIKEVG